MKYKIAVLDDDENWCLAIQRFFRGEFEVSVYKEDIDGFLMEADRYDIAIIDFSIPRARFEARTNGSEVIAKVRSSLEHPPLLVLASGFISKSDREIGVQICPEADAFLAKDAGLDIILHEVKQLLLSRNVQPKQSEDSSESLQKLNS